jgi:Domain of unknown function (DUF4382)
MRRIPNLPFSVALAAAASATLIAACGGGGSSDGIGTLRLALTDAPACGYDNVWVTVEKVRVHRSDSAGENDSGWSEVVLASPQRIDLLEYTNGNVLPLGETQLPAGTYTQMRLVLAANGNAAPYANAIQPSGGGSENKLDTPSGQQSGLKFNVNMTVPADQVASFVLDFDACRSVVRAGNSGKHLLKPVIRVIPVLSDAGQRIVGHVDPSLANTDTLVSAQQGGEVVKSTPPDATGRFVLYPVPVGTYDLVITAPGRANAVMTGVPVVSGAITTVGGAPLDPPQSASSYAAEGTIMVNPAPASIDASIRALQAVAGGPTIQAAATVADAASGVYSMMLPTAAPASVAYAASAAAFSFAPAASGAGAYTLEATSAGGSKTTSVTLTNTDVTTDFVFP